MLSQAGWWWWECDSILVLFVVRWLNADLLKLLEGPAHSWQRVCAGLLGLLDYPSYGV